MHVVFAPDSFTGTLTAIQAAEAMAAGWATAAPNDLITKVPLSDGGPGFVDVMSVALGGTSVAVTVQGPRGTHVPAALLLRDEPEGRRTAYVESAQAAGLHLLDASERDPGRTTTFGVGQLLAAAREEGATRIVVGLGGSGTNDAGAGLLAALGVGSRTRLDAGGAELIDTVETDLAALADACDQWAGIDLILATDVDAPLLGFQGASARFSRAKGATPEQSQQLERALAQFAGVVDLVLGPPSIDLLSGAPRRRDRAAGAGAAGGLGYALMLLGGRRTSGVDLVLDATGVAGLAAAADLVVTGEGCFDWQSLRDTVCAGVAQRALSTGTPCVVIAGEVLVGRREAMSAGFSGVYAVATNPEQVASAHADPISTLQERVARVAATWSP